MQNGSLNTANLNTLLSQEMVNADVAVVVAEAEAVEVNVVKAIAHKVNVVRVVKVVSAVAEVVVVPAKVVSVEPVEELPLQVMLQPLRNEQFPISVRFDSKPFHGSCPDNHCF